MSKRNAHRTHSFSVKFSSPNAFNCSRDFAEIADGRLIVDGAETRCAAFGNDYYWFSSGRPSEPYDSRFFGFVPETHIIGKVSVLLYSVDPSLPFYECLRPGRNMQIIRKPRPLGAE